MTSLAVDDRHHGILRYNARPLNVSVEADSNVHSVVLAPTSMRTNLDLSIHRRSSQVSLRRHCDHQDGGRLSTCSTSYRTLQPCQRIFLHRKVQHQRPRRNGYPECLLPVLLYESPIVSRPLYICWLIASQGNLVDVTYECLLIRAARPSRHLWKAVSIDRRRQEDCHR